MAKITIQKFAQNNKGLTLVELLIYMSIFSIICMTITSSVFYLQKIIQNNNQNYYIKNQIYFNLNILQEYLKKSRINIADNNLTVYGKNGETILIQKLENKQIKNVYKNKSFVINNYLSLEKYNLELIDNNKILKFDISWLDNRGKVQNITEYLIVMIQNM